MLDFKRQHLLFRGVIPFAAFSHTALVTIGTLLALLLIWRVWRFTVAPLLWPGEPKPLPYWIPFVVILRSGHSWEFMHHSQALFNRGHSHFPSREPYALTIVGQKIVVIQTIQEVNTLWKKTAVFTFEPFVQNIMKAFGFNHTAIENMFHDDPAHLLPMDARTSALLSDANPDGKCYFNMQSEWLRHQLHPGKNGNLKGLQDKYTRYLTESVSWPELSDKFVISSNTNEKLISLKRFTRQTLGDCAMKSFFGTKLFETSPSFLSNYQEYEDESWKIFFNYPQFMARDLHKVKDRALDDLVRYFALPTEQRPDLAWIFQTLDSELKSLRLYPRDRAGIMMMITWAINHNAHKISFWVFAHILYNPTLFTDILLETRKAFSANGSLDLNVLLSDCPHLDAVWYEVLRIYNNAAIARKATEDTAVSGKTVRAGETVLGPFRQFHTDPTIFGPGALGFDPTRFLANKSLHHTKGYYPFGGGNTYCPGRFFARSEIYIFVATALDRLDLEVAPGQTLPEVDLQVPSSSAMPTTKDVLVKIRPRGKG